MPNAKRFKSDAPNLHIKGEKVEMLSHPSEFDGLFSKVAQENWLQPRKAAIVKDDVLKTELWDPLEKGGFSIKSLAALESLQTLENYLWPGFTEDSSDWHVLLMVALLNVKRKEHLKTWSECLLALILILVCTSLLMLHSNERLV